MKNREIKFRAWSKEEKEMLYSVKDEWLFKKSYGMFSGISGGIVICPNGELMEYQKDAEKVSSEREIVTDNYILMQYTGLIDKNGKEIYEGDILETDKVIAEVCFGGRASVILIYKERENDTKVWSLLGDKTSEQIEIIGNIYEDEKNN